MKLYEGLRQKRDMYEYVKRFDTYGKPVPVDIGNVAKYYSQKGEKRINTREFPKTLSPWRSAFYEHPYFAVEGVDEDGMNQELDRVGYWVGVLDRKDDEEAFAAELEKQKAFIRQPLPAHDLAIRFIQTVYKYELHHRKNGMRPCAESMIVMFFDHEGAVLSPNVGQVGAILYSPWLAHDEALMMKYMTDTFFDSGPLFLAISLAHCKNVAISDHAPRGVIPKRGAKPGKAPGITYKTLVIDGMKETLRTEGGIAQNGLKKALHICRGHFATYTPDRPLFGKVVGTVWKPMHTRGSKERGQVVKDYKVVANDL